MSRIIKLISPKGEETTFQNQIGRPVEVEQNDVNAVLLLAIGYAALSNGYTKLEERERIKTLFLRRVKKSQLH